MQKPDLHAKRGRTLEPTSTRARTSVYALRCMCRFKRTVLVAALLAAGCAGQQASAPTSEPDLPAIPNFDKLNVVDCLLPGMIIQQGQYHTWMTPRQPMRTTAQICEIRGGEYVALDRANFATALRVWSDAANSGDPAAQTHVGEIYEKGLGIPPDYAKAAIWYRKAADQGYAQALTSLGFLYEKGLGVPRDPAQALLLYRRAVGLDKPIAEGAARDNSGLQKEVEGLRRQLAASQKETEKLRDAAALEQQRADRLQKQVDVQRRQQGQDQTTLQQLENDLRRSREETDHLKRDAQQRQEDSARLQVKIAKASQVDVASINLGTYHALVIGNEIYANHRHLRTAGKDADSVAELLRKKYGFQVKLKRDAKHDEILDELWKFVRELKPDDNLLVYYAGHGQLQSENALGYWLPIDATSSVDKSWISTTQLSEILGLIKARHVLVIADACYAGTLTRAVETVVEPGKSDAERLAWLRAMSQAKSRNAFASGGIEEVLDVGGGNHSIFAGALLDVLTQNNQIVSGHWVYEQVAPKVTSAAQKYRRKQEPEYAAMREAGHESGEFFFSPVTKSTAALARTPSVASTAP